MAEAKRKIEVTKLQKVSEVLKCIAHPVRLKVLELLEGSGSMTVTELMEATGIEQSLLSHHLTKMKDKKVLQSVREGKNIRYQLTDDQIIKIFDCMEGCDFIE